MRFFSGLLVFGLLQLGVACYGGVPLGDIDGDCVVGMSDLQLMGQQWLKGRGWEGDINDDERVNLEDYRILAGQFGASCSPLIISEFMADNEETLTVLINGEETQEDWIEIYNRSGIMISLDGWYLTDESDEMMKWGFPDGLSIQSGEYLVVIASGIKQADHPENYPYFEAGYTHTNFKLKKSGGYLALTGPDYQISQFSPEYPSQAEDVSYGLHPADDELEVFFQQPTPNGENSPTRVEAPSFSRSGCFFTSEINLVLSCDSPTGEIYYTTRGHETGVTFSRYSGPISLGVSRIIQAYTVEPGIGRSETATEYYVRVDSSVTDVDSDLPIVVVDTISTTPNQTSYIPVLTSIIDREDDGRSRLMGDAEYFGRGAIKIRGNTSTGVPKRQYAFEIQDAMGDDKDVSLLGMPKESDWILHAPYSDKTLMRNTLTYALTNDMGQYAVRCRYVELYLNMNSPIVQADDYVGIYILMEKIKRGPDRVNIEKLEPYHISEPEISGGYIVQHDRPEEDEFTWMTNRGFERLILQEPDSFDVTDEQADWIVNHFNEVEAVLFGPNYDDPETGYRAYIDAASMVDMHIMTQLGKDIDGFRLSTFFYKDRDGKIVFGPPWDYNLGWGNADYGEGYIPQGWYRAANSSYMWWDRMLSDENLRVAYADRWFTLREGLFSEESLMDRIDGIAAEVDEAKDRNFQRWDVLGIYLWPNAPGYEERLTYEDEVDWMKDWARERLEWMDGAIADEYAPEPPVFNQDGGHVAVGHEVTISSEHGTVYYTTNGEDPRLHGGGINPAANIMGGDQYRDVTVIEQGSEWAYLDDGSDQGSSWRALVYNDANWKSGYAEFGYGEGDEATVVSYGPNSQDKYRTTYFRKKFTIDDVNAIGGFSFRVKRDDGAVIYLNGIEMARSNMDPGTIDYRDFAADVAPDDGDLMNAFSGFSANYLRTGTNVVGVEIHQCNSTSSDLSFDFDMTVSEYVKGNETLELDMSTKILTRARSGSTWTAINEGRFAIGPVAESLRVTEIMYHPSLDGGEFIELKNIGDETINLNQVEFTNGISFVFSSREIEPGGYVVVVEDASVFENVYPDKVELIAGTYTGGLDNGGERITLCDAAGTEIQSIKYNDWYGITDGDGFSLVIREDAIDDPLLWSEKEGWRPSAYEAGDPGEDFSHVVPAPGAIVINELLAHSSTEPTDWVELYNTTGETINIGGWYLSDSDDNEVEQKKYRISDGTEIGGYEYVVFTQVGDFGNVNDPGCSDAFGLSEHGEDVVLRSAVDGELTGFVAKESFGASLRDISLGRYEKSGGTFNFVAMNEMTPNEGNRGPRVGPVVISEIMYHPAGNGDAEYVVLANVSGHAVVLYDDEEQMGWRFVDDPDEWGVEYVFPSEEPVVMGVDERILLVRSRVVYESVYGAVPAGVQCFEWLRGNLSNGGETLELQYPGEADAYGNRRWIRIDRVGYDDESPWPVEADGGGAALQRIDVNAYGNDVVNWEAIK